MFLKVSLLPRFHKSETYNKIIHPIGLFCIILLLSGCFGTSKGEVYPYSLPDAIVNQPYSTPIHISGGYIYAGGLQINSTPQLPNLTTKRMFDNSEDQIGNDNSILLFGIPEHTGQYKIHLSGTGSHVIPPLKFDHTYILNVLDKPFICSYPPIIYNKEEEKKKDQQAFKNPYYLRNLPPATIGKAYSQQLTLKTAFIKDKPLYKKDVEIKIYPEDSGLHFKPVKDNLYNVLQLYGEPKFIGKIEIIFYDRSPPPSTELSFIKSYILPVLPDLSHCQPNQTTNLAPPLPSTDYN